MDEGHDLGVRRRHLLRTGFVLEWITLAWNIAGVIILAALAIASGSIALAGFGLDSLIEIGASTVVIWELSGTGEHRQKIALRLIGAAFIALAGYLLIQTAMALTTGHRPDGSIGGIIWTAITATCMFALAAMKTRTGTELGNPVLRTEGHVTMIDGLLACAVLLGVLLNTALGWWWADSAATLLIVYYAIREAINIFRPRTAV
ncbi:cation transporter [Planctomonas sp. JC2975]|uniref:cation transporter n=1 Tax=Planctomonas sp. JC2975 TaxID=2729626 RepID=UPI0014741FC4|nr:cation transporter [Planctomonas sp. JC2975]NNC13670.1 cation transporter [Planctomonas sp. JC2975]